MWTCPLSIHGIAGHLYHSSHERSPLICGSTFVPSTDPAFTYTPGLHPPCWKVSGSTKFADPFSGTERVVLTLDILVASTPPKGRALGNTATPKASNVGRRDRVNRTRRSETVERIAFATARESSTGNTNAQEFRLLASALHSNLDGVLRCASLACAQWMVDNKWGIHKYLITYESWENLCQLELRSI